MQIINVVDAWVMGLIVMAGVKQPDTPREAQMKESGGLGILSKDDGHDLDGVSLRGKITSSSTTPGYPLNAADSRGFS